ncbi:hypothetical protein ACIQC9_02815 [Brevundimonas sp. NPDC092305]|uniref:hypothetical protein n=1 Tax=Brevundimonas sp. NPDC092305 TaxID=3363957 RepID=UPI003822683C
MAGLDRIMPDKDYLDLRDSLLKASSQMSCRQALDLADLLHTVIRMRKPHRPLRNLEALFVGEPVSFAPPAE